MSYNVTLTLSRTPAGTYFPKSQLGFLLQVNILKAQPVLVKYLHSTSLPVYGAFYNGYYLMCYLWGPEHNLLRPRVFHPTVARGAVGFKSNGWQLGSAGGTQCLVSSNTRQRENSPPLAVGRLEECSHSSNTPFTRLSLHESKATVTHFVSR